ncbi:MULTISPECIES: oxidoreductase [Motiliproteus]|nr:oxidoreductase [Motiliproteus coralliicola]
MQNSATLSEVFEGLTALSNGAFPKQCGSCGKSYADLEQLVAETSTSEDGSGLKQVGSFSPQVEVERICSCGQLLTETFGDRRSSGEVGAQRRALFDRLLSLLIEGGMPTTMAKKELIKVMKGQPSELLNRDQLARFFS